MDGPDRGSSRSFSTQERNEIAQRLTIQLPKSDVCTRPGPSGVKLTYLEGWRAVDKANELFGFDGWSCSVRSLSVDFIEEKETGPNRKRYMASASAVVRVALKDGTFHEDTGSGSAELPSKSEALEKARKEAVTDARKRALKNFGNALGNSLYDREHLRKLAKTKVEVDVKKEVERVMGEANSHRPVLDDTTNRNGARREVTLIQSRASAVMREGAATRPCVVGTEKERMLREAVRELLDLENAFD